MSSSIPLQQDFSYGCTMFHLTNNSLICLFFLFKTETTQALLNDQRMEKQEPSSRINFFYNILCLKSRYLENNVSALKNESLEMVKYIYLLGGRKIYMYEWKFYY